MLALTVCGNVQVIGATSSLTYNVVGHIKTVIILTGGCMFFGDEMPLKKFLGIATAMLGIVWYSQARGPPPGSAKASSARGLAGVQALRLRLLEALPMRLYCLFALSRAERLAAFCTFVAQVSCPRVFAVAA